MVFHLNAHQSVFQIHCTNCLTSQSPLVPFPLTGSWEVTAIPKGTNSKHPSGYQPISVLPIVSKLIERHIRSIIMEFL